MKKNSSQLLKPCSFTSAEMFPVVLEVLSNLFFADDCQTSFALSFYLILILFVCFFSKQISFMYFVASH
ncbi:MAG TPA: hypothetical protein DCE80_12330 [Ignavibacteriales bacterium]|nr:MAG: hypothetical protein A2006_06320 [Ignavibacteria bacterium GWC2_35_8]HAB52936.1 hypothetical protein [Ignavibacteriales bacterium]